MVLLAWQLMMATGLAASAGLRAFLPLLVVGVAGRYELIPLSSRFEWVASTPALTVFAVAVVLEIGADKIPVVDHVLDIVATFVRPIAGAVVAASSLTELDPLAGAVVGLILGGSVATGVHAAKSTLRMVSTAGTGGLANPAVSVAEDAASLAASVAALFVPVAAFALTVGVLWLLWRRRSRQRQRGPARRADV